MDSIQQNGRGSRGRRKLVLAQFVGVAAGVWVATLIGMRWYEGLGLIIAAKLFERAVWPSG